MVEVPPFEPIYFEPKSGMEEESYALYKAARTVDPEDVYDSNTKVPWYEFDSKGTD
jgi:polypeptide N-acetylgalactosaminyltransferase